MPQLAIWREFVEDRAGRANVDGFCRLHELKKREEGRKKKGKMEKRRNEEEWPSSYNL